jgi:hypothetical protein
MKIIGHWGVSAQRIRYRCSNKRIPDSQFPTALLALESFFGLLLGSCPSAAWTLHRAHLCQRAIRSWCEDIECGLHRGLLQSTFHRHPSGCYSVCRHFWFHDADVEVGPAKSISCSFQSVALNSERTTRYQVIFPATLPIWRTRTKEAQKTRSTHSIPLPIYLPGKSSCGTSCVRTSFSLESPASPRPSPPRPRTRFPPRATRPHSQSPPLGRGIIPASLRLLAQSRSQSPVRTRYPRFGLSPEPVS